MLHSKIPDIKIERSFCNLPFNKIIINAFGEISMCCYQLTQLGNIKKDDIIQVWRGMIAQQIRNFTKNHQLHPVCTSWRNCPFQTTPKIDYDFEVYKDYKYPTTLEISLPDKHCNIGGDTIDANNPPCIMCIRNFRDYTQYEDITDLICYKIKPLVKYLKYFSVLGVAEPFWKNAVFDIFDKIDYKKYQNNIVFTTNTNVTCLTDKVIDKFFDYVRYSDLSFSIDAATPATFRKIRRVDSYDFVIKNIRNYILKRDSTRHITCVYNNINMLNVHEMTDMVLIAKDLGVDKMIMIPTHDQAGIVKLGELTLNEKNIKIFKENADQAMNKACEIGMKLHYPKTFDIPPVKLVQITIK